MDKAEIKKIAHLARLAMENDPIERYAHDLSNILALVDQMNQVDTDGVAPMAHPLDADIRFRADEVTETDQRQRFQQEAPNVDNGLYLVPKVIE